MGGEGGILRGIDGCRFGWIHASKYVDGSLSAGIIRHFADLDIASGDSIAVDIPIGLPDFGSRRCDIEARKLLGRPKGASVFPAPIRPMLSAGNYEEACRIGTRVHGKKISKQCWNILPKIHEIDDLLQARPKLRSVLYEVHPEVAFRAMNDGTPILLKKRTAAGKATRRTLVENHFGPGIFGRLKSLLPRGGFGDDDLLDALAALWTAERIVAGRAVTIPDKPEYDPHGLPMRIVY